MRIGVSLRSAYATDDHRLGARWMIERARAAYAAGLDSLFVGDHHNTAAFPYYQNVAIMGRLLADWHERTAGVLMLLPLWNPVLAAEQVGTLAAIHDGPFVLQCAIGAGEGQFAALGADLRTRPSRFEAALDVVRRLLAGEVVTQESPFRIGPTRIAPITPEPLEVWIGAAAPAAIDRAARLGDVFLAGPEATPADARRLIDEYRARCDAHGRNPTRIAIRRDIHIGADATEIARVVQPIIDRGYRGFDPAALVVGEAATAGDAFAELATMGYTDVIVRHLADDHAAVLSSFERLAGVRDALADL
jgi:alkanesulfonate monooxygenase SsuD/methylene tetrahydromethanopterin reductase-like flavin-dependent oxidoreductase (luciferase family)